MPNSKLYDALPAELVTKVIAAREIHRDLTSTAKILSTHPEFAEIIESAQSTEALAAFKIWVDRQTRKAHPDGTFDSAKRWEPSPAEHCICCSSIRTPTRAWPFSLNKHCRGIEHVANLRGVHAEDIKSVAFALIRLEIQAQYLG